MKINAHTAIPQLNMDRVDPKLMDAAKGMEANFLRQMMKTMRDSVGENEDDKNNQGLQIFRGMLDEHYADQAANKNSLGIAEMIVRYLTQQDSVPIAAKIPSVPDNSDSLGNAALERKEGK